MDLAKPNFLHRDYWILKSIRQALDAFVAQYGAELRGGRALDLGCKDSPYRSIIESVGAKLLLADINPATSEVLPIDPISSAVPLPNASVDLILSTQVLEHVPEVGNYLSEARRLLRPNGLLFLTTHGTWYLHRGPTDMRRWTIDGLRYDVENCGFIVESVDPRIGILATATHARLFAIDALLRRTRLLAPCRILINLLFNLRMGIEELITSHAAREKLQQLIVVIARAK
jgi:SAM-dependent methyltransferase